MGGQDGDFLDQTRFCGPHNPVAMRRDTDSKVMFPSGSP